MRRTLRSEGGKSGGSDFAHISAGDRAGDGGFMEKKKRVLGYYNYTVVLTYIGMLCGFTGIICAMEKNFSSALVCLLVAGVCDMFDGAIASTRERDDSERRFGIQIDSLSDLVCFGVLPAAFVCSIGERSYVCFWIAGAYLLCTLIRLAYFNVLEEERQASDAGRRKSYMGMPVTTMAMLLPAVNELCRYRRVNSLMPYCVLLFLAGGAYLAPVTIKKPAIVGKIIMIVIGVVEVTALALGVIWDI